MATRLDAALVERGLARSRAQAQALIKAGAVTLDGKLAGKATAKVESHTVIAVADTELNQYVSRGGIKLAAALAQVNLNPAGLTALDMGQSTGGFSDCLLQAGVAKVVGIDVGREQLVQSLRDHPKLICYEGVNGRELPVAELLSHTPLQQGFDLAVMDVSFISQTLILPALIPLLKPGGQLLSLVKPQFELQPEQISRVGLVKSADSYPLVELKIREFLAAAEMEVLDYFASSIEGGDGNREFFVFARKLD